MYADWIAAPELQHRYRRSKISMSLVIWRTPWDESLSRAVEAMRARGKTVVFDCDDLMTEPNLAKTSIIDGIRTRT